MTCWPIEFKIYTRVSFSELSDCKPEIESTSEVGFGNTSVAMNEPISFSEMDSLDSA